jgi:protoheme IX farnesyltransferase
MSDPSTPTETKVVSTPKEQHGLVQEILALCKPRVIELLITTALPAMFLAEQGYPHPKAIFGVLIGGTLAAGSSNAINSIIERDIDHKMHRTAHRPMAQKRLTTRFAWTFAISAQIISVLIVAVLANVVAAFFTLLASLTYVFVYTLWLKPRTDQNIVIGGAAGAFPAVIGYSAVTATAPWQAWAMFTVIFLWTPAHFWALAIFHEKDYRLGGFPMLPITRGRRVATQWITFYTLATVTVSFTLLFDSALGVIYACAAAVVGAWFVAEAIYLMAKEKSLHRSRYMRFFHVSNAYLALVFIAIAVDAVIGS